TRSVAWGDVDGDGDLDLAAGSWYTATVIYLNVDGSLQTSPSWSSEDGDRSNSVAWGDINGDGDLDLAVGNNDANKVYLNQNGVLQTTASWSSGDGDSTSSLTWGDIDGDGDLDLVAGNLSTPNKIYLNENGTLQVAADNNLWTSKENNRTLSVALADVDRDGDLDLVSGNDNQPNKLYLNGKGNHVLPMNAPFLTASRPITPPLTSFYVPPQIVSDDIIPISYKLFDYEGDTVGQIRAEYSLNGGGQWFPATATQDTITTNLATSAWPTGTEHIYYWDTFASGFFGQSDNVVFRIEAYSQPASSAANGTYQYTNLTPFPIQRPYASATTYAFRVRGTQVQVFSETISAENAVPNAVVYQQSDGSLGEPMANEGGDVPFTTDSNGYLSGRGQLDIGDQLFAALPVTTTYRTPPQLIWDGVGTAEVTLNNAPSSAVTAEFWLLPTADEGKLFTLGGLTLSNPLDLTINGQSTGINIGDGFPHHVALGWQDSNNAWNLIVDGKSVANGVADILLDSSLILGDGYQGSFDEIRVWNVVRSSAQISETLFVPLNGNEVSLVGYWPVEESDSSVVADASGHGNDLSLSGDVAVYFKPLYTVYHTSGAPTPSGVALFEVTEPGVQQLVVSKDNPLMLFDLDVSLEWDASGDSDYLDRLDKDIKRASEILYDLTNGQVAFGNINVYQDKELWDQADIQVYVNNNQRPNANLGGIVTNYLTDTLKTGEVVGNAFLPGKIRIGATWNRYGNPGGTVGEDWPRVLAHEFGHYGLFLL
ncbi:MAG: VCBS repeat-containing protein, partial [Anaerolineales bacterium]|nr:VCBS repeat-containing protein [Anaerolineales bacterium]